MNQLRYPFSNLETPTPTPSKSVLNKMQVNINRDGDDSNDKAAQNRFKTRGSGLTLASFSGGAQGQAQAQGGVDHVEGPEHTDSNESNAMPPPPPPVARPVPGFLVGLAPRGLPLPAKPDELNCPKWIPGDLKRQTSLEKQPQAGVNNWAGVAKPPPHFNQNSRISDQRGSSPELSADIDLSHKVDRKNSAGNKRSRSGEGGKKSSKSKRKSRKVKPVELEPQPQDSDYDMYDEERLLQSPPYHQDPLRDPLAPISALFEGPLPHIQQAQAHLSTSFGNGKNAGSTKWDECTIEEWEQGGLELAGKFNELLGKMIEIVKRKAKRNAEVSEKMKEHNEILEERRSKLDRSHANLRIWAQDIKDQQD